ncbi:ATP-binding protein [Magnetovirga frankeli]|uniref:ATP-binding protein n=1 Tax=Magnetovirga frankeli TaxID=947516 RepID=UPI0012932039|nr:ATP-binding protein [gamma proteobacterium SS-5]
MNSQLKPLPTGHSTLATLIDEGMVYIDKTPLVHRLTRYPGRFFLSRPRRFGKSLLVDTFQQLFEGNERLFRDLYIHDQWDWSRRHPVIKIDFAAGELQSKEALDIRLYRILKENQERLGISCDWDTNDVPGCLSQLILRAREQFGEKVVVLVDEYDKPMLDNIENLETAAEMRSGLKNLYSVLKAQDAQLQFVFLTGVTKFSKVSIFSGINQLEDITLDKAYATICGYTQHDLETSFAGHLAGVDWARLRRWYNGYRFLGDAVYNPFDILLFISKDRMYRNYWVETGSPSFLVKLFRQRRYFLPQLESIEVGEEILDSFDIEHINPVTLLFQSGYLTIASTQTRRSRLVFRLAIPNQEVKLSLHQYFLDGYLQVEMDQRSRYQDQLYDQLISGDLPQLIATLKRLFAAIPWRNFTNNAMADFEGYYASVLFAFFESLNAQVIPEDITNQGQVDMSIELEGWIYVMEIKLLDSAADLVEGKNPALQQIQARGYSEKYRGKASQGLFELGLVFGREERNLIQADWLKPH